jgi:O-acetyl-ADP-ribose deacetylase (regulator of RNase III)
MIEAGTGNLLASDAEALVNTVNTVGVMGKGIALQFKNAYPSNFKAYAAVCKRNEVVPGKMLVHDTGVMGSAARYIINFPTKRHWKGKSRIEDIEAGLVDLVCVLREYDIQSVAVPPLGCGNGGLDWGVVEPMIRSALEQVSNVRVILHAPNGAPANEDMLIATPAPRLTGPRAAMIAVMDKYLLPDYKLSALEAQKLAYFLQVAGLPMKLEFTKQKFGPYAENLNHALIAMEGHFMRGFGDRSSKVALHLLPGAAVEAEAYLAGDASVTEVVRNVSELVRGYETPYGLELLATVHWATEQIGSDEDDQVCKYVEAWTPRKGEIFTPEHVAKALNRLRASGLVAA